MTSTLPAPSTAALDALADAVVGVEQAVAAQARQGVAGTPLAQALVAVGDRWSLAVVAQLLDGPQRFNELASALVPIARTVLSDRLRKLEDVGVVARRRYSEAPVRYTYRLTVAGAELGAVCGLLADWGSRNLGTGAATLEHAGCGGVVGPAWRCQSCGPVSARDVRDTSRSTD